MSESAPESSGLPASGLPEQERPRQSTADKLLQQTGWRSKYRLPIVLMIVAIALYAFSIFWIISGRGAGA